MASVKQSWIKKYGEAEGLIRWEEYKKTVGRKKDQIINEHGQKYYDSLVEKRRTYSLESCIEKYGKVLGEKKWQERRDKKLKTQQKRKEDGFIYRNGRTLDEYQSRYGIDEGYRKWQDRNRKQSYRFSKQFYIDKYGDTDGVSMWEEYLKSMDKCSLESYVDRYGVIDGTIKYNIRLQECKVSEEKMIQKYGEELGREKYKNWLLSITKSGKDLCKKSCSKSSQELFWKVYNMLSDELKKSSYFYELNQEYQFFINNKSEHPNKIIVADFKCKNSIIEFDGSYWHDPNFDKIRDNVLNERGYRVLRIDYNDYCKDKKFFIQKCVDFINENA